VAKPSVRIQMHKSFQAAETLAQAYRHNIERSTTNASKALICVERIMEKRIVNISAWFMERCGG
jgi:hypothetical protein